ncbi:hypothetical protein [Pseudotenacibaculum haliotis]|uniref:Peptidase S74 domain-containing protein n=1 Tax=Pseudotenacibaculum haliotis TaxID=1862138 RepID=A0ABW5LU28_9FLAO
MRAKLRLLIGALFMSTITYAQVGVGTSTPNTSAQLEVVSLDKGILIPRIALTGSTDATTIANGNVNSLLVYNTATVGTDLTPGYYYWENSRWNRVVNQDDVARFETVTSLSLNSTSGILSYNDEDGTTTDINLATVIDNFETVTTITVDSVNGDLVYTDENGTVNTLSLISLVQTHEAVTILGMNVNTYNLEYVDENGTTTSIDLTRTGGDLRRLGTRNHITSDAGTGSNGTSVGTGSDNIFIGSGAGGSNTAGSFNVFIGSNAGNDGATSLGGTYIGSNAGINATGSFNTFVGASSGFNSTGTSNTFIGYQSGQNSTAGFNSFLGYQAGQNTSTGTENTFFGSVAGRDNTTGDDNVFLGSTSGQGNTTGFRNNFLGSRSGIHNTLGANNTFIGYEAGFLNTTGNQNVFLGNSAGSANTTGSTNVVLGNASGNITTGSNNIVIGEGVGVIDPTASNQMNIGGAIFATGVNANGGITSVSSPSKVGIGIAAHATARLHIDGDVVVNSGDITTTSGDFITESNTYADYVFEKVLDGVSTLNKTYKFKTLEEVEEFIKKNKHLPGVTGIGELKRSKDGGYMVNMSKLSIETLEKTEELYLHTISQQKKINTLQSNYALQQEKMRKLQQENDALKSRLENIEKMLGVKK